jgi:hypothetical protein
MIATVTSIEEVIRLARPPRWFDPQPYAVARERMDLRDAIDGFIALCDEDVEIFARRLRSEAPNP